MRAVMFLCSLKDSSDVLQSSLPFVRDFPVVPCLAFVCVFAVHSRDLLELLRQTDCCAMCLKYLYAFITLWRKSCCQGNCSFDLDWYDRGN